MTRTTEAHAGFQGSRTTGAEVTLYSLGGDPVLKNAEGSMVFDGRDNLPDSAPSVLSISTSKSLGTAAGTWTVQVKAPTALGLSKPALDEQIVDDDWADVVFRIHGRKTHVLRGQVDTIRWEQSSQGGTPARVYTLSGKDFGGILEKTYAWFNNFTQENMLGQKTREIWGEQQTDAPFLVVDPSKAVRQAIFGFLETLTGAGHPDWQLPPSMMADFATFPDAAKYVVNVDPEPARFALSQNFVNPNGSPLWTFAQQMSDPMFTELFCDLGKAPGGGQLDPEDEGTPLDGRAQSATTMSVFYRDKPFISGLTGMQGPWFSLPMVTVTPQAISRMELGRSGAERFTAFMVAPLLSNEFFRKVLTIPSWDKEAIRRHGMRQMSIESQYRAVEEKNTGLTRDQRARVVHWHALNAYLLNGSIQLGALYPQIRVGTRLRVSSGDERTQLTFYVEQVSHTWSLQAGGSTTVGVTRGWRGSDNDYLLRLQAAVGGFETPPVPGAEG